MRLDASKIGLLLDTNIWMSYFTREDSTYRDCELLLETAVANDAPLLVSPTTLKDVFYLIPRRFHRQDASAGKDNISYEPVAWGCLDFMLDIATPSPLSLIECTMANTLRGRFGDFEDNLILATGESAGAEYIVTYDKPLLKRFPEACITPKRALELLGSIIA